MSLVDISLDLGKLKAFILTEADRANSRKKVSLIILEYLNRVENSSIPYLVTIPRANIISQHTTTSIKELNTIIDNYREESRIRITIS